MEPLSPGEYFALFAEESPGIWTTLIGRKIEHTEYGLGKIVEVIPRDNYIPLVKVRFVSDNELRTFNAESFKSGRICQLDVSAEIEASLYGWKAEFDKKRLETERRKSALAVGRAALQLLGDKYHVPLNCLINDEGPTSIAPILIKIDERQPLTDSETILLGEKKLFNVLATYHFREYRKNQDPWLLVKVSSELRKANLPEKAVEITSGLDELQILDRRPLSALWTTRGGALKDTGKLDEAIRCGKKAIALLPSSYHAHNLLGSILYEREEFEQGQKHFDQALELGSPARSQEYELRATMNRATSEQCRAIVEFLLRKDPDRFSWARTFV